MMHGVQKLVMVNLTLLLLMAIPVAAAPEAASSRPVVLRFADIPVEMATGEYVLYELPDFALKSRGGGVLDLTRNYRSQRHEEGMFGYGWSWSHGYRLDIDPWNDDVTFVTPRYTTAIEADSKTVTRYASWASSGSYDTWLNDAGAVGPPDAQGGLSKVAHNVEIAVGSLADLTAGGWGFPELTNNYTITKVVLACAGGCEYPMWDPNWGVKYELHAGAGSYIYWGDSPSALPWIDITADRSTWTWADVNSLQAKVSVASYIQNAALTVYVDAFWVIVTYTENETGEFAYEPGSDFVLEETGSVYTVTYDDLRQFEFSGYDGRLLKEVDPNGNAFSFTYDIDDRLTSVTNDTGGSLTFSYEDGSADAFVTNVTDHLGRSVSYSYATNNLAEVIDLETNSVRYAYWTTLADTNLYQNMLRRYDAEGHMDSIVYYSGDASDTTCYSDDPSDSDKVKKYWDKLSDELDNEIRFIYTNRSTFSYLPDQNSYQGVARNAENDISHVFIRSGTPSRLSS